MRAYIIYMNIHIQIVRIEPQKRPGRGIDDGERDEIGEEIGGKVSRWKDGRHVLGERFGGGGEDQARLSGAAISGDDDTDGAPAAGAGEAGEAERHWSEEKARKRERVWTLKFLILVKIRVRKILKHPQFCI